MIFSLPENNLQKSLIINALGRKWEFTFTTLVTFGGAFFASFPLFYATSFGGAYWVWIAILFSFTIQAVAYEFRSKSGNVYGKRTFDIFLFINGSFGPFLIGTAVATFFTGSRFTLNALNQVQWMTHWYGLEALFNIRNILLGLAVLFVARMNGLLYIINSVDDNELSHTIKRRLILNSLLFLVSFIAFIITLLFSKGFAFDPITGIVSEVKFKYLYNFLQMPLVLIIFLSGVCLVLGGLILALFKGRRDGIWYTGTGTIMAVFSLFLIAGFNNTSFYPSISNIQDSLTIYNSSSSYFTLNTMMYISFIIPLVIAYIWYAWKSINNTRITEVELNSAHHRY